MPCATFCGVFVGIMGALDIVELYGMERSAHSVCGEEVYAITGMLLDLIGISFRRCHVPRYY